MKKEHVISKEDALVIVDVQNDFLPGGALPVPEGDQVIPVLNDYAKIFQKAGAKVFATRDWHPPNHISFKAQGGPWPPHCVQQSEGARFSPALKLPEGTEIISKATDPAKESYSGFDGTELAAKLKARGTKRVFVGGLATDYCVLNTVLDALKQGFDTVLLLDATRGINVKPGDVNRAIDLMTAKGADQATLDDFPDSLETPLHEEPTAEAIADKPLSKLEIKRKARMRPRGPYKRVRTERG
ncbi:nicotinamidase [Candidatus Bathyarchaeota archaeon A05DMB-2]|nr:nicotinamidase [Candidatus Bathyarchaeota archaeon A05DMB-2]